MSGMIAGAVVVGGMSMYASSEANKSADAQAASANANNALAANMSRAKAEANSIARRAELLKRFNIKSGKVMDTNQAINTATAVDLTNFDMQMSSAQSVTDNALATKQISGRLAERLKNVQEIQGDMQRDTIIQSSQAQHREVGDNLEMMRMDYESENMNLDIDLSNSINAANNAEIRGVSYSSSTGSVGVISSGVSGAIRGASIGGTVGTAIKS